MVVMIERDWDDTLMWSYFCRTISKLKTISTPQEQAEISYFRLADGYVFGFNGIYALADKSSKVSELYVLKPNCLKIQYVNTFECSKTKTKLVRKIREFFDVLNDVILAAIEEKQPTITVRTEQKITCNMFKAQLFTENSI